MSVLRKAVTRICGLRDFTTPTNFEKYASDRLADSEVFCHNLTYYSQCYKAMHIDAKIGKRAVMRTIRASIYTTEGKQVRGMNAEQLQMMMGQRLDR